MEARCTCTTCNVLMGPTQLAQNDRVWTHFYAFFQFDIEFFTLWFWGQSQRNIVLTFIIISHSQFTNLRGSSNRKAVTSLINYLFSYSQPCWICKQLRHYDQQRHFSLNIFTKLEVSI